MPGRVLLAAVLCAALLLGICSLPGCAGKEAPTISSLDPESGAAGSKLKIIGQRFGATPSDSKVRIGGRVAEALSWSDTEVTAAVPSGLASGAQAVDLTTAGGSSNEVDFTVTGTAESNGPGGSGETPAIVNTMSAYMSRKGIDPTGYSFSVTKVSSTDPNWKTDQAEKLGLAGPYYFILRKSGANWTVVTASSALTPQQIKTAGAPADLWQSVPTGYPKNQTDVIRVALLSMGVDATSVTVEPVDASASDPEWQLFVAHLQSMQPTYFVLHLVNGQWVVANSGGDVSKTPGLPRDLLNPEQ